MTENDCYQLMIYLLTDICPSLLRLCGYWKAELRSYKQLSGVVIGVLQGVTKMCVCYHAFVLHHQYHNYL